jgi:hypothetical protein
MYARWLRHVLLLDEYVQRKIFSYDYETSLRTAIAEENSLDKEATSYDDILDAYQLAIKMYEFQKE